MSYLNGAKRRRLNDDVSALTKPFVSPLKSGRNGPTTPKTDGIDKYQPSNLIHSTATEPQVGHTAAVGAPPPDTPLARVSNGRGRYSGATTIGRRVDVAEVAAQRALTKLEMQIRSVQNDIDSLNHAAALRSSQTDADLEELCLKWKLASQAAADELFVTVKDRVDQAGGVAAWRESERGRGNRFSQHDSFAEDATAENDADCQYDSQGEELPDTEQVRRRALKREAIEDARQAAEHVARADEQADECARPEIDSCDGMFFTMEMMLRSMNAPLDVMGYDREAERWAD